MNNKIKDIGIQEKLRWFQIFASLYDIAAPHIHFFTDLKCQSPEELVADLETCEQNARILRKLLAIIINIPEPPEEALISTRKYFETALSHCLNVSEALVKYIRLDEHTTESQIQFNNLINSLVLAREYVESTYRRLYP